MANDADCREDQNQGQFVHSVFGSALSGLFARAICHPLDTCKSRIQGPEGRLFKNTFQTLLVTTREEGILGLYRGFGAVLVGGVPGVTIYLTSYEICKDALLAKLNGNFESLAHISSGLIAEGLCCIVFVPVDVIKERLQVQRSFSSNSLQYKNSFDALKQILRHEGLRGIYKGYGATMLSFGPYSALYFGFYEKMKEVSAVVAKCPVQDLPFSYLLSSATFSAALASWITNPLDLAKLRLQVQRAQPQYNHQKDAVVKPMMSSQRYKSMLDGVIKIYRCEGLRGLYRGAGARVAFQSPNMALTVSLFDMCKNFFASIF